MSAEQDRVIVTTGGTAAGGVQVHHREFPEIRAEGADPAAAANQLVNHLTRALDTALTKWRREAMEQAITDVRAFASGTAARA